MGRVSIAVLSCAVVTAWAQTCQVCGEIRAIREVSAAPRSSAGAKPSQSQIGTPSDLDGGPLVGTVAQFQFGRGEGNWRFGAVGTPEMQARLGQTYYEIVVAMDGGDKRTVERRDVSRFFVGQRVALRSGELEPMQP
jgi:outer membrane lipoprotein SlyB